MCSCKRTTLLVFSLTAGSTFVHFNVLVWWKLQVSWCYCVEYIRISPFLIFFTFHKVVWPQRYGMVRKVTTVLLQIPCWIQWWKKFENRPTKLWTKNIVGLFLTHSVYTVSTDYVHACMRVGDDVYLFNRHSINHSRWQ